MSRKRRILAIVSGKGGVAKTSTALALAAEAHRRGHSTVLVDCDPIGAATDGCGIDVVSLTASGRGLAVALAGGRVDEQLVVGIEGFRVLGATAALLRAEATAQATLPDRLASLEAEIVIVDTPPGFGGLVRGAIEFATSIVAVVTVEPMATRSLDYLLELLDTLDARKRLAGVVPTIVDARRASLNEAQLKAIIARGLRLLPSIPRAIAVAAAPFAGSSVVAAAPRSTAAAAYSDLADALKI